MNNQQNNKVEKKRLDVLIHENRQDLSRSIIQDWIKKGLVMVAGKIVTKPGQLVDSNATFTLQLEQPEFVSRSGAKLAQALQQFSIDVQGVVALDVGLSTGGFTDCLLQNGAAKVFGVAVGTGQVHPKIVADDRVVVMEQTDIRNCLGKIEPVDFICVDVSFISVTKIIDVIIALLKQSGIMIILLKPQFETNSKLISRGGIVKHVALRKQIVQEVLSKLEHAGLIIKGCVESLTHGSDGNIEYLVYGMKK